MQGVKRKREGDQEETKESPRVVVLDFATECGIETEVLKDVCKVEALNMQEGDEIPAKAKEAEAILMWHIGGLDANHLSKLKAKAIIRVGMGFDNVDLQAAGRLGIVVCNVPDYGTEEVADHTLSLLLNIARKTYHLAKRVEDSKGTQFPTMEARGSFRLRGKKIGLIGCGRIGTAVALRCKAFRLHVTFFDPYVASGYEKALGVHRLRSLKELMEQSDIISLHCYLSKETRHIVNSTSLSWCKRGSVLLNTARGGLVEEKALIAFLKSGHLLAAGIDVLEKEPYEDGHLHKDPIPNLILTPHSAWYSDQSEQELRTKAAEEARRVVIGVKVLNCVNLRYLNSKTVRCETETIDQS